MAEELIGYPDDDSSFGFPTVYWKAWDVDATFLPGRHLPPGSLGHLWAALTIVYYGDKVVLADIDTSRILPVAPPEHGAISALAWSPNGTQLALGTESGFAAIIDLSKRE